MRKSPAPGDRVAPPFLIRNGTGGQEWIPRPDPPPNQAVAFEILPFEEMPQTINPRSGIIINANNDQAGNSLDNDPLNDFRPGGGLRYLSWGGRNYSIRAGRITRLLGPGPGNDDHGHRNNARLNFEDMIATQADVVMLDAQVFTPFIRRAFKRALSDTAHPALAALAADPAVAEAVERLGDWDHSTPTGIAEGFDARLGKKAKYEDDDRDERGRHRKDGQADEVASSVAASLFAVWRHEIVANTIDARLVTDAVLYTTDERSEVARLGSTDMALLHTRFFPGGGRVAAAGSIDFKGHRSALIAVFEVPDP